MKRRFIVFSILILSLLLLPGCSLLQFLPTTGEGGTKSGDRVSPVVDQKKETSSIPSEPSEIEVTGYGEQIGAILTAPAKDLWNSEDGKLLIAGRFKQKIDFPSPFVWIDVFSEEDEKFTYYIPVQDKGFQKEITLFDGAGKYHVKVRLPSGDQENQFYDFAEFDVLNDGTEIRRDIEWLLPSFESKLTFSNPVEGMINADGTFQLEGTLETKGNELMIVEKKDGEQVQEYLQVKDGRFSGEVPLHLGKGSHSVTVLVPDPNRDKYYLEAARFQIDNSSETVTEPIEFAQSYFDRSFTLDYPKASGLKAGGEMKLSGSLDTKLEENRTLTHIFVKTDMGNESVSYTIPVINGRFEGNFWLRFGPGEYKVMVGFPKGVNEETFQYEIEGIAQFKVVSDAQDKRDILPSWGIDSDHAEIKALADQLTKGRASEREKAKAIYDYVSKNMTYDVKKLKGNLFSFDDNAVKALHTKMGVCQDYAYLAAALSRAAGLEAHLAIGNVNSGAGNLAHGWVEVKVDGKWLTMDPTWGSGYLNEKEEFVRKYTPEYFDPDPNQFGKTHYKNEIRY